jgi:polyisoprenyl-teichoic acid--peptidoglycan teichoic acid transferase
MFRGLAELAKVRVLGITFIAALLAGLVLTTAILRVDERERNALVARFVHQAASVTVPAPQSLFDKDHLLVLLLGLDYDYTDRDMPSSAHSRSDTIMVAALDLKSSQIHLVSVPRDMDAHFDGHDNKINAAYSNGGINEADNVIGSWLGLPQVAPGRYFDRYMVLRIAATKDLVNAIGGVDVVPDETMNYDDSWGHLHIHFTGGKVYHMNGDQAVSYMRFRHDACSDPCRIKRQQQVIRIVLAKLEKDKLNDLYHLRDLVDVTRRDIVTNFKTQELLSLANAYASFNLADLKTTQIPFTGDYSTGYAGDMLIPDEPGKARIVASLFEPQFDPSKVRLRVENGSGVPGLASSLAAALHKEGFVIAAVTKADASYPTTVIRLAPTAPPGVDDVLRRDLNLSGAQVLADVAAAQHDVTIIVGKDYATAAPRQ